MRAASKRADSVLVIDVGGTHVKVLVTGQREEREIPSGSNMTARKMVRDVKRVTKDWEYGFVSIGFPGPCCTDALSASRTIWAAAGSDLISTRHSDVQLRLSTMLPCRRSEATRVAACSFWASARDSGPQ